MNQCHASLDSMPPMPKSILVLGANYPPEPTGNAPYTGSLTRGLAARGMGLRVLTTHPHYPEWKIAPGYGQWARREKIHGVDVLRLRHYVPRSPTSVRRAVAELSAGLRQACVKWGRPEVIVSVSPALLATFVAMTRAQVTHRSTPTVVWVQDLYSLGLSETGQGSGLILRMMRAIEGWVLRSADCVVVIHERFATRVNRDFGVPHHRIEVVRNWTHLTADSPTDVDAVRNQFGWGADEIIVLHAGNMGVKQGLMNVVHAARLADQQQSSVRFVFLGEGSERTSLAREAMGIERIQFIDPLPGPQFQAALQAADVLLVNEKQGISEMSVPSKLTSYFNAGKPVLAASDVLGATAEEITAAGAGLVVPAGDPQALLEGATRIGREAEAAEWARNGLRYRRTVLDEETALDRFGEIFGALLAGTVAQAPASAGREERSMQ